MTDKINGRTPEEIKKGLECGVTKRCAFRSCPYWKDADDCESCISESQADALALINQLQEDKKQLERERDEAWEIVEMLNTQFKIMVDVFESEKRKYVKVCNERDAAVEGLTIIANNTGSCIMCKHRIHPGYVCDRFEREENCYEWRGLQEVE